MSTRQEKVNSLIQQLISQHLVEDKPEGITGLVTVTAVDVSGDLEHAKIFFSSLGQDPQDVLEILKKNIYEIQGVLYNKLEMKKVPRIAFISDSSGEYAEYISKVLKKLHGD
ncbi:MAG: ribosome-binding factor A [Candidatus Doudnabacteria bacterium RIFCSPHIGHO2_01_FULL_46_14]|uniref:Ribosome-binding factor A n=1 Tax=Candidatus Doudnabacteria bacterium RIFCSPHIGHO2_01_FULL_46_14 TaxID=1817824 RepID=A0A1F5NJD4_9BACT|nr:MAG: ribosome-binding factor A [Candidatus Doudnabacteria bacterium RIFCSPHIGHO2_01_FULL_46_14]